MAGATMLVHVTHIDDSTRGRQGPCVFFWGMTHDRSLYLLMEKYLESVRHYLEARPPPLNLNLLDQICCVLINHQWHRGRVPELKLSHAGTIEVFCIDSGDTHSVPLAFVRTLDIPGHEAEHIREWPPLASKFILADMVAPRGPGSRCHWSEPAMMFLKIHVENRTWKAAPMGMYGEHQGVRLFNSNNQLLATLMIQQGLGVAAQTYHEALNMSDVIEKQPAYMKPAANIGQIGGNGPIANNTLPPSFAIPSTYRDQHPAFAMAAKYSPIQSPILPRAFVTNDIPHKGRHDVIVTHIPDGPQKFYVQLKSEAKELLNLRKKLDSVAAHPFHGKPKLGTPCIAFSSTDKLFHRGLITALSECGNQCNCSVYFADIGTQEPVSLALIWNIPDELLVPRLFAYRVSLFGVEEVLELIGLNEMFTALVNSAAHLQVEVVEDDEGKQKVNLYDPNGRSLREVLVSIYSNFMMSTSQTIASRSSTPRQSNVIPTCVTDISTIQLNLEENLCVIYPEEPGCFFGQFEKIPVNSLNEIVEELTATYSSNPNPPLLYADVRSHVGHYGVLLWEEDNNFYRIRITKEMVNDAEIRLIDYGNCLQVPRCKILAPLEGLTCFCLPPYGIHCRLESDVTLSASEWKDAMFDKSIKVTMGKCENGIYSVTLTNDPCNDDVVKMVSKKVTPTCSVMDSISAISIGSNSPPSVATHLIPPAEPRRQSDDRRKRNNDSSNFGRIHYVHPNAKDSNWRSAGTEEGSQSTQTKSFSKDTNWRVPANPIQEVIRAPRGPPPSTGNGETKGPVGFQRLGLTEQSQPPVIKPMTEPSAFAVIPTMSKPATAVPLQKNLSYPIPVVPGGSKQVEVVCVVNPSSFYLRLSEASSLLADMVCKLNVLYADATQPCIQNAKAGSPCVVQYEGDKQWYRGKILAFSDSTLTIPQVLVLFVDYGNTQLSPLNQVKYIDEAFVQIPPQAFHCKLKGVESSNTWTIEDEDKFKAYTTTKTLTATFSACNSEGKYAVRLIDENEGVTKVINDSFGISPPIGGYTYLPVSEAPMDVTIAWYHNPGRIFTSPVDLTAYQIKLDELEQFYSPMSPDQLVEDQPTVGLPCVARFTEDKRYYRSRILAIQDNMAKVLFVDYGNEQDTPLSQLKRIVPRFMNFPQLTWHSKLKGVKKMATGPLNPNPHQHITACFLTGQTLTASFHPVGEDNSGVFEVDFVVPGIGDAAQYLIQQKILDSKPLEIQTKLAVQSLNFIPGQIISSHAVSTHIKSATEFWVHLEPESIFVIKDRIDALALDPKFINAKDYRASVGKPCLAFFADDDHWYRAVVESVDGDTAIVYYVDYGNSCAVNTSDLRALPVEVSQQPAFAYKCSMDGAETLTEEVAQAFESFVSELTAFTVQCVSVTEGILNVCLYSIDGIDLIEQLRNTHLTQPQIEESPVKDVANVSVPTIETQDDVITEESGRVISTVMEEDFIDNSLVVTQPLTSESVTEEHTPIDFVKVYISYSISPNEFWLQLRQNDDKLYELLDEMAEMYKMDIESYRIKEQPFVHQIYGVLHPSYGAFYRAEVKGITENIAEVHFVDYGDTFEVQVEDILHLPQRFTDIPAMAIPGSLSVESSKAVAEKFNAVCFEPNQIHWAMFETDENGLQCVKSLLVGDKNVLDLITVEEPVVVPYDIGLSTISEALIEQSVQTPTEEYFNNISLDRDVEILVQAEDASFSSPLKVDVEVKTEDISSLDLTELPTLDLNFAPGQRMSSCASVSHIESATDIWIQLEPNTVCSLMGQIAAVDASTLATAEPHVGNHCLALFPFDEQWYRAVVTHTAIGFDQVRVTYVDYGNSSMVNVGNLRVLPTEFIQQPALALKCALDGIERNVMSCPTTDQCTAVLYEEIVTVVFSSRTCDRIYVRLFDVTGCDLNEKLGLPETFKIDVVGTNLLEFTACDDVEMASPIIKTAEPAVFDLLDGENIMQLEGVTPYEMAENPTAECSEILGAELVDSMQQISMEEKERTETFVQITDGQSEKETTVIDRIHSVKENDAGESFTPVAIDQLENEEAKVVHETEQAAAEEDVFPKNPVQIAVVFSKNKVDTVAKRIQQAVLVEDHFAANLMPVATGDSEDKGTEAVDNILQTPVQENDRLESFVQIDPGNSENEETEIADHMPQVVMTEDNLPESYSDPIDSFIREALLEPNMELKESEVREQLTILEQETSCTDDSTKISIQETEQFTSPNEMIIESLNINEDESTTVDVHGSQVIAALETRVETSESLLIRDSLVRANVDEYDEQIVMRIKSEIVSDDEIDRVPKGNVYVSHVVSPGDFWMQNIEDAPIIGEVDHTLSITNLDSSPKNELTQLLVAGGLYAAKHHFFCYWYRVKLLKIEGNIADVLFVDYGDLQKVPTADIRELPPTLQTVPPMAFHCKLAALHLNCWPEKTTEVMKSVCQPETECRATFRGKVDGVVEVESLLVGHYDVVRAVLSSLVCDHHADGSWQQPVQQPISSQINESYPETPKVDAQLFFIRVQPNSDTAKTGQNPVEGESRLPSD